MIPRWYELPEPFLRAAARRGTVLLHSAKPDEVEHASWLYADPVETLVLDDAGGIESFLAEAEAWRMRGRWLAGWVGYEAGYALVGVEDPPQTITPAAWLGVYDGVWRFDHLTGELERVGSDSGLLEPETGEPDRVGVDARRSDLRDGALDAGGSPQSAPAAEPPLRPGHDHSEGTETTAHLPSFGPFGLDEDAYRAALARIHAYLSAGDTYQVNFTDRFEVEFGGDLLDVYRSLIGAQPVPYAAFVNAGHVQIASLSPELFFRAEGRAITTRPMKGTAPRGRDNAEDAALAAQLRSDEKSRAENVMIVDLLRNDLGRVCEHGSVRVPELFDVERYRTVQQMTSTVTGELRDGVGLPGLFAALFPCGSVTGAPKRRTMQIIRELERGPRGVYTGAIGHASPEGDMTFNVAIRTLAQVPRDAQGEAERVVLGAGGGIVADSDPDAEYRECVLKARFATHPDPPFELIETMRWDDGYRLLDAHLARLRASAEYFGFALDDDAIRAALQDRAARLEPGTVHRVGVRLPASGAFRISEQPFQDEPASPLRVAIADDRIDSRDPFRRHKTTRRAAYDAARVRAAREGLADVLFLNERGELAEGAISNVFLDIEGELWTPPLDAGALPGVFRSHLLERESNAREAVLTLADLERAEGVYICSALRGLRRVALLAGVSSSFVSS